MPDRRETVTDFDWTRFEAALFDLDGVLTPTATVHELAWKRTFDAFLRDMGGDGCVPFRSEDYLAHVDGRPRYDGVRSFLASRGVTLPEGDPADPPGHRTVCALGNAKNAEFQRVLADTGVDPYPDALDLLDALAASGVRMAVVSSSANATQVLSSAALAHRFPVVMDGVEARRRGLAGKPAPDTFLAAARAIRAIPAATVVLEDAVSGIEAGVAGGFGATIGVDRTGSGAALSAAGADLVVADLRRLLPQHPG